MIFIFKPEREVLMDGTPVHVELDALEAPSEIEQHAVTIGVTLVIGETRIECTLERFPVHLLARRLGATDPSEH